MQQLTGRSSLGWSQGVDHRCNGIPYEFWLKLFGLIDSKLINKVRDATAKGAPLSELTSKSHQSPKKLIVMIILSFISLKRLASMIINDKLITSYLGDYSRIWIKSPIFYQFPLLVYPFTALLIVRRYNSHEKDLKCFIPFAPTPDAPIPCQCYKKKKYKTRIILMSLTVILIGLTITLMSSPVMLKFYYRVNNSNPSNNSDINNIIINSGINTGTKNDTNYDTDYNVFEDDWRGRVALGWSIVDYWVNLLTLGIIMFTLLYFDLICLVIGNKFRSIEEVIDAAALQCLKNRKDPQFFDSLTGLFNNYLDINDIVTDSDHFWGKISFYIISSHTTLLLFVVYSFIYSGMPELGYFFITIGSHSLFVLFKICQSCYDVSYASAKRGYDNLSKINEFEAPKVVMMKILAFRRYMDSETIGYSGIYTKVTYETLFSWMFLIASLFLIIMDFANGTLTTGLDMKYR